MNAELTRNEPIKIWIIEDNIGDLLLLQELLIDLNFKSRNIRHFDNLNSFEAALETDTPNVLLLDLFLAETRGIETFEKIKHCTSLFPIIILSGLNNMETALDSVKMGAQDYLIKDESNDEMINKMINYAIERFANTNNLRISEEKYRMLFQSIPLAVVMLDENNCVVEINDTAKTLLDIKNDMKGISYTDIFPGALQKIQANDGLLNNENILIKLTDHETKIKYIEQSSISNQTSDGFRSLVTLTDRTAIVENEMNRNRIVHETLDQERSRFSSELHDGLAQYLIVLNIQLEMLKGIEEKVDEGLIPCIDNLNASLNMLRSISYNLSPADLNKGLIPALKALFNRLQSVNKVRFELMPSDEISESDLSFFDEYAIFRIIQEFINNSLKYSECATIRCEIEILNHHVRIVMTDDGKGFDIATAKKGLGLENSEQRAFAAGFDLQLTSEIGKGTNMTLLSEQTIDL
jgi:signal transduction histidine kinase